MQFTPAQESLFSQAKALVQDFITKRGTFSLFALAQMADGSIVPVHSTDEFESAQAAIGGVLEALAPMARAGSIDGCVICTPMDEGATAIVYDVDFREGGRMLLVQTNKKKLFGGWSFGSLEIMPSESRLFAS